MKQALRIGCLCLLIQAPVYAGELGDYEGGVSTPPPQEGTPSGSGGGSSGGVYSSGDDDDCCSFFDFVSGMFRYGTGNSVQRMFAGGADGVEPRQMGEALLPLLRYDNYYSHLNANQDSIDQRMEVGWGPVAFEYRRTSFTQAVPAYQLLWEQRNFLWRLTFGSHVGINYGIGDAILTGATMNFGSSGVFQLFIHGRRYGLEYRSVGTSFESGAYQSDEDLTLMLHLGAGSLSVGYRRLAIPGNVLSGYYLGYSLRL